jgi:DNA-binding NarL/FixJ family response regulator
MHSCGCGAPTPVEGLRVGVTSPAMPTTVVLCDDHVVMTQGLVAILASEPDLLVTGVAASVAEVVELVDRQPPDVVLIDYELPDGDGVAATRAIKEAHPEVQVVMLTSYGDDRVLVAAIEAGCSGYVTKHSPGQVVAAAIRQAAAGEAVISASMLHHLLPQLRTTDRGLGTTLTPREHQILEMLADGASGRAIAERLYLSFNTVRNHAQSILDKLGVHSRLEAVAVAVQEGIIERSRQSDPSWE